MSDTNKRIPRSLRVLKDHRCLLVIVLFSACIRFHDIGANLPFTYWQDENNSVEQALRFGTGNFKPHSLHHGMVLPMVLSAEYCAYFAIEKLAGRAHSPSDLASEYLSDPTNFYLIGRATSALFGIGCIVLVYLIALRAYGRRAACLSSLLFGVALSPYIQSIWVKDDTLSTFLLLLSFLLSLMAASYPDRDAHNQKRLNLYIVSALCVGLAAATKYYAVFGYGFILFFHLFGVSEEASKARYHFRWAFNKGLVISTLCVPIGFLAGNPYIAVDPKYFFENIHQLRTNMSSSAGGTSWAAYFTHHLNNVFGSVPIEMMIMASLIALVFKRSRKDLALVVYPVLFYCFYIQYIGFAHYLIPAAAFLSIIAGSFLAGIFDRAPSTVIRRVYRCVFLIFLLPSLINMIRFDKIVSAPDTRTTAKRWIEDTIPGDATILAEGHISTATAHVPPLRENIASLERDRQTVKEHGGNGSLIDRKISYARKDREGTRYDLYKVRDLDADTVERISADYVIVTDFAHMDVGEYEYLRGADFLIKRNAVNDRLARTYDKVKTFSPFPGFSVYFPIFIMRDFQTLARIDIFDMRELLLQGPAITIYERKR